ncbi:LD-carboxypeptidase [bacterium]|nr:LD-carboxypeptidase [candidate division CSSED10-310 bacterium]
MARNLGEHLSRGGIRPPPVPSGGTIGLTCPGGPVARSRLAAGVDWLRGKGFNVVVHAAVYRRRGYLAGTDEERAEALHELLRNPKVDMIMAARGGYGSIRLLEQLDYSLFTAHPKVLVGYSDITSLLLAVHARTGLITFHGPMAAVDLAGGVPALTGQSLLAMIGGCGPSVLCASAWPDWSVITPGCATGPLVGGCLTLLTALVGTPYMPDLNGTILFLEEVNEDPYRVDRMLTQLRLSGCLQRTAGIVIGALTNCIPQDDEPSPTAEEVIADRLADLHIPVVRGVPFGHQEVALTLPLGAIAHLDSDTGLHLLESPCLGDRAGELPRCGGME